jgi:hypothetical protein
MPIFPFDDEEERRRRRPFLTPPINPEADMLDEPPDLPPRPRAMLPPPGNPGGMEAPEYTPQDMAPPSRYQRLEAEKQGYMRGTPGRFKSALTGALQGLAAGGPGGALTGAAYGAIDPRRVREVEFNQRVRPQIQERFAFEDQQRAVERQAEQDALNAEYRRAQIGELGRRGLPKPAAPQRPIIVPPGGTAIDLDTRQPIFTAPERIKPPTTAELQIDPESGMSVEEMADASYNARGGDNYVLSKLPPATRQIIERGTVMIKGKEEEASPEEKGAAQRAFDNAINRQRSTDMQYTRGHIRSRRVGGGKAQPVKSGTGINRPRSQFNSKKFPGLKFD